MAVTTDEFSLAESLGVAEPSVDEHRARYGALVAVAMGADWEQVTTPLRLNSWDMTQMGQTRGRPSWLAAERHWYSVYVYSGDPESRPYQCSRTREIQPIFDDQLRRFDTTYVNVFDGQYGTPTPTLNVLTHREGETSRTLRQFVIPAELRPQVLEADVIPVDLWGLTE
jgi:hypothetical protein